METCRTKNQLRLLEETKQIKAATSYFSKIIKLYFKGFCWHMVLFPEKLANACENWYSLCMPFTQEFLAVRNSVFLMHPRGGAKVKYVLTAFII